MKTAVCSFFFCFHLAFLIIMIVRFISFLCMAVVCSFELLCSIPLYAYTTIYWTIQFLIGICVICPSQAVINSAALNIFVHTCWLTYASFLSKKWIVGL